LRQRSGRSKVPRTCIGQWLRAALLCQQELAGKLSLKINGGTKAGWNNDDEPAVIEAAAELLFPRYFGASYDVRAVTAFAAEIRDGTAGSSRPLPQLEVEAVIRSALGESDVITNDITLNEKVRIYLIALVGTTTRLGIDTAAVARVIVEAEQMAFERGWNPPLADG
jgi:hypothetical protein